MSKPLAIALEFARNFLGWWIAELAFLVPPMLRQRLAVKDTLVVTLDGERASVAHEIAGRSRALGELASAAGVSELPRILGADRALQQRFLRGRLPVTLRLPADAAVRTHISLPLAVEHNLRQALVFQLDRRTPFAPDTVHSAHRVVGRDEAAKQIEIDLTVVPRGVVADAVSLGKTLGVTASAVEVAAGSAAEMPSGNLLPDAERPRRRPTTLVLRVAAAAAAVAAIVAVCRPVYVAQRTASELQARTQSAKALADRTRQMKEQVAKLGEAERFLTASKEQIPTASELLYRLTHILPDDTWVQQVTITASEIRISGFSGSSSNLIQLLGQSGVFLEPQFRAAVTQDTASGKERFDIAAKIARKALS